MHKAKDKTAVVSAGSGGLEIANCACWRPLLSPCHSKASRLKALVWDGFIGAARQDIGNYSFCGHPMVQQSRNDGCIHILKPFALRIGGLPNLEDRVC